MEKVKIYAPGDGALSFVWTDGNSRYVSREVTERDATQAMIDRLSPMHDFKLVCVCGEWRLIPDVNKDAEGTLNFSDRKFMRKDGMFYVHISEFNEWALTENLSITSALKFYLENQLLYNVPMVLDHNLKNSPSYNSQKWGRAKRIKVKGE